jgi:hypothetical protein
MDIACVPGERLRLRFMEYGLVGIFLLARSVQCVRHKITRCHVVSSDTRQK